MKQTELTIADSPHRDVWQWDGETHERNMRLAIEAARSARATGRLAIGVVLVDEECRVVARGCDLVATCCDPTAHAETTAIRSAAQQLRRTQLPDLVLYSTLEPCPMCLAACAWASLGGVVFGADGAFTARSYYQPGDGAVEYAARLRRSVNGSPLFIRGHVLRRETAALL